MPVVVQAFLMPTYCISILAQIFENYNCLQNLEKFTSINGAQHYEIPINKEKN